MIPQHIHLDAPIAVTRWFDARKQEPPKTGKYLAVCYVKDQNSGHVNIEMEVVQWGVVSSCNYEPVYGFFHHKIGHLAVIMWSFLPKMPELPV